jgi:3-isopropylmalate/(R)-2-methylmalate dehydratase small subunit
MKGKIIKYEDNNINTDLIIPARYLIKSDYDFLAQHCMEDLDPEFNEKRREMGASILVGGINFGCGSSREQAPIAIKAAGIQCVIAPSYARIFFRNSINIGLPIVEFEDIKGLNTGDEIEINFEQGKLKNHSTNKEYEIIKMPTFLQEIISANGLVHFARNKILNKK